MFTLLEISNKAKGYSLADQQRQTIKDQLKI